MSTTTFFNLDPNTVLSACETAGMQPTGLFSQLNSYENRVFDIELEGRSKIIAKFYRPERWPKLAILEEHRFLMQLNQNEIPCLKPLVLPNQSTLLTVSGIHVAFFPKFIGRMPQELALSEINRVGQLMARVHNVGSHEKARYRPIMDSSYYGGWQTLDFLADKISPEVKDRYLSAAENILEFIDQEFDQSEFFRIHGDAHKGNLLLFDDIFYLVDFDDFCMGPCIQDMWMLLSHDKDSILDEQHAFIEGYEMFREFPLHQLGWVESLRGLRILMYAGWIAKRWTDPSFPKLFPDFGTFSYWAEEVEALEKVSWSL